MKKSVSNLFCVVILAALIAGCKKDSCRPDFLQGSWELRKLYGGLVTTTYPPGNGNIINFSGNHYIITANGQIVISGEYRIVTDFSVRESTCLDIPAGLYAKRIIFDNNIDAPKTFLERFGNKLTLLSGCEVADGGNYRDYEKQ